MNLNKLFLEHSRVNKKLLFVVTNPIQFKGFFRNKLELIDKRIEIYLLIYPYGFFNPDLKKEIKSWTDSLKKKSVIKNAWYLKKYSYQNINENINFNIDFLKTLEKIKLKNFDFIMVSALGHYWEKIIVKYFHKKKIIGYLLSPPSGMDFFNSLSDFFKSIKDKNFFHTKNQYVVKSDNKRIHRINTESKKSKINIFILSFILEKIIIRINLFINLFIIPIYLKLPIIKINRFYDRINFNYFGTNKIVCFNPSLINIIKMAYPNQKIDCYNLLDSKVKNLENNEWAYLLSNNSEKSLEVFYQIIKNLKKLNKISKLYIKQHPSWLSERLGPNFYKKLKEIKIPFKVLKKTENTIYEKYKGIILEPGGSIIEGLTHNPKLKILAIKSSYIDVSGALYQFYKKFTGICWSHDVKNLKKYLKRENNSNFKVIKKFEINELDH